MYRTIKALLLITLICWVVAIAQSSSHTSSRQRTDAYNVAFCDLLKQSDKYDGKIVRFRAKYISTFEVSALVDGNCTDKDNRVWADFDRESVKCFTLPDVLKKVEEQVYCCMYADLSSIRETEMLVTGVFLKPNGQGYGHDNNYRFKFTIKSVQEVAATKTIKVPGVN